MIDERILMMAMTVINSISVKPRFSSGIFDIVDIQFRMQMALRSTLLGRNAKCTRKEDFKANACDYYEEHYEQDNDICLFRSAYQSSAEPNTKSSQKVLQHAQTIPLNQYGHLLSPSSRRAGLVS